MTIPAIPTAFPLDFTPGLSPGRIRCHVLYTTGVQAWYPPPGHEHPTPSWRRTRSEPR